MNTLKIRTSCENYYMDCLAPYDGKTFKITDKYLNVFQYGAQIRHIELTDNIKLELNRIRSNAFIKDIGWARTFAVWLIAADGGESSNEKTADDWTIFSNHERNKLDNSLIQQMILSGEF